MRKSFIFALFASAFMLAAMPSCKNNLSDDDTTASQTEHGKRVVTIACSEEQVGTSESPMTRAGGSDAKVIGINILRATGDGYENYAYGLFDGTTAITAVLDEGEKYKIECVELRNGEDTLFHVGTSYFEPFLSNKKPVELTNSFTYSTTAGIDTIADGKFAVRASSDDGLTGRTFLWNPRAYTYYGCAEGFDPATASSITLNLRRAVFGLHFVVTPPEYGSATMKYLSQELSISAGDDTYDHESIFSFSDIDVSSADGYGKTIKLFSAWTKRNGEVESDTLTIPITRNYITTVEIGFSGPRNEGIKLNEEQGAFSSDTVRFTIGK